MGGDDPVARDEDGEVAAGAKAASGASGPRRSGKRGELPVRDDLSARDRAKRLGAACEEGCLVVEVDRHVLDRRVFAREVRLQQLHDFRHEVAALPLRFP